jgi:hypothetical protein
MKGAGTLVAKITQIKDITPPAWARAKAKAEVVANARQSTILILDGFSATHTVPNLPASLSFTFAAGVRLNYYSR